MSESMNKQNIHIIDTTNLTKKVKLESDNQKFTEETEISDNINQLINNAIDNEKISTFQQEILQKTEISLQKEEYILNDNDQKDPQLQKQEIQIQEDEVQSIQKVQEPSHQNHRFTEKFSRLIEKLNLKPQPDLDSNSDDLADKKRKQPYTILEDIQILHFVMISESNPYSVSFWKDIEDRKMVSRSAESMRDRYRKYLKFLTDLNLQDVYDYIQTKGTWGFLEFQNDKSKTNENLIELDPLDIIYYNAPQKDKKIMVGIMSIDPRIIKNKKVFKKK